MKAIYLARLLKKVLQILAKKARYISSIRRKKVRNKITREFVLQMQKTRIFAFNLIMLKKISYKKINVNIILRFLSFANLFRNDNFVTN